MSEKPKPKTATAHYRNLVRAANRKGVDYDGYTGNSEPCMTWFQLNKLEADVSGIDIALKNALIFAMVRYDDFIGKTDLEFEDYRAQERKEFAQFFNDGFYAIEFGAAFMETACKLPYTQCLAWLCRSTMQYTRADMISPPDKDPPRWAVGKLVGDAKIREEEETLQRTLQRLREEAQRTELPRLGEKEDDDGIPF
jgi:hypothetical protein